MIPGAKGRIDLRCKRILADFGVQHGQSSPSTLDSVWTSYHTFFLLEGQIGNGETFLKRRGTFSHFPTQQLPAAASRARVSFMSMLCFRWPDKRKRRKCVPERDQRGNLGLAKARLLVPDLAWDRSAGCGNHVVSSESLQELQVFLHIHVVFFLDRLMRH